MVLRHCYGGGTYRGVGRNWRRVLYIFSPPLFFLPRSLSLPPLPIPFLLYPSSPVRSMAPLKPARGSGSTVSSGLRSGTKPRPKKNLMHSRTVRKSLVAIILCILKRMLCIRWIEKLDYICSWHLITPLRTPLGTYDNCPNSCLAPCFLTL